MSQKEHYRLGPCYILSAANVTDPIADWFNHGYTQGNVVATIVPGKTILNRVDQLGNMPLASAVYKFGDTFELSFPLIDKQIDNMLKVVPGSVKLTNAAKDAFALTRGVTKVSGRAFALVPVEEFTEGDPWWDSEHAIMVFNGVANINDRIDTYKLAEENDLAPFEVTVMHVDSDHGHGSIGPAWFAGIDVIGFNVVGEFAKRVTDADVRTALGAIDTMRELVDNTGAINLSTSILSSVAGLEYAFNSSGLDVSDNNVSESDMSAFIVAVWKARANFGAASTALNISLNNGVDADATARINGTGIYLYAIVAVDQANKTITVEGDQRGKFPAGRKFYVEGNTGTTESHNIVAVNTTNNIVEISGDQTAKLAVNGTFEISGSTGNNGIYTVSAITYNGTSGNTEITTSESITNATADGQVIITLSDNNGTYTVADDLIVEYKPTADQTRIPVVETIPDPTADGSINDGLIGAGMTVTT